MKRATRGTRALGWVTGASLAVAIGVAVLGVTQHGSGNSQLAIVVGDLRARAAEATLVARAADVATDTYTRMQAMQLARRIDDARDELSSVTGGDDAVKQGARKQVDALVDATRRLQHPSSKDEALALQAELAAISRALAALERSIS